jgi:hypothetical protein
MPMSPNSSLLAATEETIETLTETSLLLVEATRWAERDRFSLSPLGLLAGPLKYWKWHQAKRRLEFAIGQIERLRTRTAEARDLPDVAASISALDAVNDLYDVLPFNVRRVGTPGGPSPIKQQLGVETTVLHQIETTRLGVDHLLSEVGLLHARLRAVCASAPTPQTPA